jgi:hypothetical protein
MNLMLYTNKPMGIRELQVLSKTISDITGKEYGFMYLINHPMEFELTSCTKISNIVRNEIEIIVGIFLIALDITITKMEWKPI